ncbi:TetR/AcrR family transcriptional regulator [Tenggerimyces flavus]|uniref:TetR/AcrR family transcriptional regulator n=1 Tax=Tenggerimyces flavus TaxID=1708749 RepID=A0ABV7YDJ7_9ACTN|nr:TetR/AcrR family transcriptional regulator [Tenggerimyces flavus]MBM7791305.1 AcrR family transcriptional regulator [Tenggerimyces flavus]
MATTTGRRSSADTRTHVLEVAHELFYWHGIHAVGVDKVAAEAGVAPTTLYRLFASKDDLVAAYVENAANDYRDWFSAAAERGGDDPAQRILALFDAQVATTQPEVCRGCPYLMALTEFPDEELAIHRHAVEVKAWVREQFAQLAKKTRPNDSDTLADQLMLVFEGVYATVQALGADGPAARARALVELLVTTPPRTAPPRSSRAARSSRTAG